MTRSENLAIFRSHRHPDRALAGRGIYHQLATEWTRLAGSAATSVTVRRWARDEPGLTGLADAGAIVDAIDAANRADTDRLLRALLNLFHSGHQLAGRILLQAMLPKLSHTARARRGTDNADLEPEDRRCNVVAAFWEVLDRPGEGRTSNLAGSLALDTLNLLTRTSRRGEKEAAVEPSWFEHGEDAARSCRRRGHTSRRRLVPDVAETIVDPTEPNDCWHLEDFIDWGLHVNAISRAEADALTAVYTVWPQSSADAATDLGISPANLRQRCSRATRSLAAAVHTNSATVRELELAS